MQIVSYDFKTIFLLSKHGKQFNQNSVMRNSNNKMFYSLNTVHKGALHALRPEDFQRIPDLFVGVEASFFCNKIGSWHDSI